MEPRVYTTKELRGILDRISFRPSCVNMDWQWDIESVTKPDAALNWPEQLVVGWLVNTSFVRPDTLKGEIGRGKGRKEFIAAGTSLSGVVKTCWLLAELIVRHELMEAFCFDFKRVFDPHRTIEQLTRE